MAVDSLDRRFLLVTSPRAGAGRSGGALNSHPTVKSVELMRWLCRLITPPGGVVLDPFLGSGSTMIAAEKTGRRCYGMDIDPAYVDVSVARWEAFTGEKAAREAHKEAA